MTVPVLPADIDEQNHVNNTVYLRWIQDVATTHWKSLASAQSQAAIGWIVLRHEIDYKTPASLGDEIVLRTWVGQASRLKFERFTEIRRKIDDHPVAILWVRKEFFGDAGNANNGLFFSRVIKKHAITLFHRLEMVAGLKIPYPIPRGLFVLLKVIPGIRSRFGFH